jgi:hypothetical protein
MFNFDHIGAKVRQQHGGKGRRYHVSRVDDTDAFEGLVFALSGQGESVVFFDVVTHG